MLGLPGAPGIGTSQLLIATIGIGLAVWGFAGSGSRLRAIISRIFLALGSVYFALWMVELLLAYPFNKRKGFKPIYKSVTGLYQAGDKTSFRHVPNYQGTLDDGIVSAPLSINSRGDRDAEPRDDLPLHRRVLLVGDSFTFGYGLSAAETIDARLESRAETPLEAYNLGVMSYGTGDSLLRMQETTWWQGERVYYLFFENDLHNDNSAPGTFAMHNGVLLPMFRPDGEPRADAELDAMAKRFLAPDTGANSKSTFLTSFALYRVGQLRARIFDPDLRITGYPASTYRPGNIDAALGYTEQMQALATERGASFTVVVLPCMGAVAAGHYATHAQSYVDGLATRGIETIELLDRLTTDDYFVHDPHFDASGADATAAAIHEHLQAG